MGHWFPERRHFHGEGIAVLKPPLGKGSQLPAMETADRTWAPLDSALSLLPALRWPCGSLHATGIASFLLAWKQLMGSYDRSCGTLISNEIPSETGAFPVCEPQRTSLFSLGESHEMFNL